jgi:lipoate-protein ligase A
VAYGLDLIVQPRLEPRQSLAADRYLLREVSDPTRPPGGALRVYDLAGDVLSLGRYHLAPPPVAAAASVMRRHSGGRASACGAGFVGVSLVLPHRSALVAPEPLALAPEQVMNRYVRGILQGLKLAGAAAFYPGRDLVTLEQRMLGLVSFEVDHAGALLFEAVIADDGDFARLPVLLDAADPGGVVRAAMLTPADAASLAAVRGQTLGTAAMAELLRQGYEERLGVTFTERRFTADEMRAIDTIAARELADETWLQARAPRADLDRRATTAGQLGALEVHLALGDGRIRELVLAGDFLANSPAVARLERELRGAPAEATAIEAVVAEVLSAPGNFVLGLGAPGVLAATIVRAVAS